MDAEVLLQISVLVWLCQWQTEHVRVFSITYLVALGTYLVAQSLTDVWISGSQESTDLRQLRFMLDLVMLCSICVFVKVNQKNYKNWDSNAVSFADLVHLEHPQKTHKIPREHSNTLTFLNEPLYGEHMVFGVHDTWDGFRQGRWRAESSLLGLLLPSSSRPSPSCSSPQCMRLWPFALDSAFP